MIMVMNVHNHFPLSLKMIVAQKWGRMGGLMCHSQINDSTLEECFMQNRARD